MAIGTVKRLPNVKNYGFLLVTGDGGTPEEIFFHRTSVTGDQFDQLKSGQRVAFEVVRDPRDTSKLRAVDVTPLEG